MRLDIITEFTEKTKKQWDNLIYHSKTGTFFQTTEWLESVQAGLNLPAKHLVAYETDRLIGVFPNFIKNKRANIKKNVSIPLGSGGPVIIKDEKKIIHLMLKLLDKNLYSQHKIICHDHAYLRYNDFFKLFDYKLDMDSCRFIIDLDSYNINKDVKPSRKRKIKNANKKIQISILPLTEDNLRTFYALYSSLVKKFGSTALPFNFFSVLLEKCASNILLVGASLEKIIIGSHLYILDNSRSTIFHFLSGIEKGYTNDHISDILHKYALNWSVQNGYRYYDFGNARTNFEDGLFRYKESFGGRPVPTITWTKNSKLYKLLKIK